ncbi:MAG: hypothetical protein IJH39_05000 [Clostridia bacterium]|nr:hypothetical protein [Clostridia bacterium]
MNIQELTEKIKSNQASYNELLEWCSENKDKMNLNDFNEFCLYNTLINELFKFKIGKMNRKETSIFIKFFATKLACELKIGDKVKVEILDNEKFNEKYKGHSDDIGLHIPSKDGTCTVSYNLSKMEKKLNSDKHFILLEGLQVVFHEIRHAYQQVGMSQEGVYAKALYIMAMETITRKVSPQFYKDNYGKLLIENDAQKAGLQIALSTIG